MSLNGDKGTLLASAIGVMIGAMVRLPLMGLDKAVIEPLAKRQFREQGTRILPHLAALFDRLDPVMPVAIAVLDTEQLVKFVTDNLEELTGEDWPDPEEIEPFFIEYNPKTNAQKISHGQATEEVLQALQRLAPSERGNRPAGGFDAPEAAAADG